MVELTVEQWKKARGRLWDWNYHNYREKDKGWFRFDVVEIDGIKYLTEVLPEGTNLPRVPENYREGSDYQQFINEMEIGIYKYRAA